MLNLSIPYKQSKGWGNDIQNVFTSIETCYTASRDINSAADTPTLWFLIVTAPLWVAATLTNKRIVYEKF